MPSPWTLAGALAAAYALGLLPDHGQDIARLREDLRKEQQIRRASELRAQAVAAQERHRLQMSQLNALLSATAKMSRGG